MCSKKGRRVTTTPRVLRSVRDPSQAAARAIAEAVSNDPTCGSILVVDVGRIAARMQELHLLARRDDIRMLHTVKASSRAEILAVAAAAGLGFDVSNESELALVRGAVADPDWVSFTPSSLNARSLRSLAELVKDGRVNRFHLDSLTQLKRWIDVAEPGPVGLRLNISPEAWPDNVVARRVSRFGLPERDLPAAQALVKGHGSHIAQLHVHNASENNDIRSFTESLALMLERGRECAPQLSGVNLGGGLPKTSAVEIAPMFAQLRAIAPDLEIVIEPGRWWSMESVHLVTEVLDVKISDRCVFVVVSAGSESRRWSVPNLPSLGPHPDAPDRPYVICGATAFEQDFMGQVAPDPDAPIPAVGDRLVLGGFSTYSVELLTQFNGVTTAVRMVS